MGEPNEEHDGSESDVPEELLKLHVELEDAGVTPDEFKEAVG